jgi:DtxR family transcriptional regulator, Mn-dependent transcriptional regulator
MSTRTYESNAVNFEWSNKTVYSGQNSMVPSETTENYLKAIYLAEAAEQPVGKRVSVGQVASALGVVPGTATTMMKALAEYGFVYYEPYAGVRLTAAGAKLAGGVLRRHRLMEVFLVKVLGMSWVDVHDEAERLEHAVSERLIDRIDDMLGSPAVDPHGDPIPSAEGATIRAEYPDLLTAPLHTPLVVMRVIDQQVEFLRFLELHGLVPGSPITIDARVPASDTVDLRSDAAERVTIGARAAAKILVSVP